MANAGSDRSMNGMWSDWNCGVLVTLKLVKKKMYWLLDLSVNSFLFANV